MVSYIAFLRGINVSGQKKIKMTDLQDMCLNLGFKEVSTYIQSGNIVFKTDDIIETGLLEEKIKEQILKVFGFNVPVLVKTKEAIEAILVNNPYSQTEEKKRYFVLLKEVADKDLVASLMKETYENETFFITDTCIYLNCKQGYGKAKCNNNFFERKLKVTATTRNFKTMHKMFVLAEG